MYHKFNQEITFFDENEIKMYKNVFEIRCVSLILFGFILYFRPLRPRFAGAGAAADVDVEAVAEPDA